MDKVRVNFNIEKGKYKKLKKLMVDKETTITKLLTEYIDKVIKENGK